MAHAAFQRHFVGTDNLLTERSQCALAMALQFGLLNDEQKKSAAQMLENSVRALDNHLNTGFLGTPLLLHALSDNGKLDTAYALLEQTTLPSWLYPVTQGATTIWERWNSYSLQDGFGDVRMNSFNHYAYGAVADWLYMNCGGIRPLAEKPGFREFILAPQPGGSFRNMEISFDSPAGMIRSAWQRLQDKTIYEFTVPEGTTAYCRIGLESEKILKGGQYRFEI